MWKMVSMLDFGMICGVGIRPLKKYFQTYMALSVYPGNLVTHFCCSIDEIFCSSMYLKLL
jgi:hypothetical protein